MSKQRPARRSIFADEVDGLFVRLLKGEAQSEKHSRDAREVAVGLSVLRRLIDAYTNNTPRGEWAARGIFCAAGLIDGLMSGKSHPIQRYIDDVKYGRRRHKAAVCEITAFRQACVVGFLRAYQTVTNKSRSSAAKKVVELCGSNDFSFTDNTIIEWDKKFRKMGYLAPDAFATKLMESAKNLNDHISEEAVIRLGLELVDDFWTVPFAKGARVIRPGHITNTSPAVCE